MRPIASIDWVPTHCCNSWDSEKLDSSLHILHQYITCYQSQQSDVQIADRSYSMGLSAAMTGQQTKARVPISSTSPQDQRPPLVTTLFYRVSCRRVVSDRELPDRTSARINRYFLHATLEVSDSAILKHSNRELKKENDSL